MAEPLYIDLSAPVLARIETRLEHYVEAVAVALRDEITTGIETAPARTGRKYRIPGTKQTYTASAPGEVPAERTADYKNKWANSPAARDGDVIRATVHNPVVVGSEKIPLGIVLEEGASDIVNYRVLIEPRPHIRPAIRRAKAKARELAKQMGAVE